MAKQNENINFQEPLELGTKTPWGEVSMVGFTGGERYYWITKENEVAMIPAAMVEKMLKNERA